MSKPLILVTNDDGYQAPGIRFLIDVMKEIGDVIVVAPESPQSGMGHAITIRIPLTLRQIYKNETYSEYITNGTPVDAVKLATHTLMDRTPDLLVSGINHGSNSSVNIIYSGTMAAVIEGAMNRIPSVGFSLLDYSIDADFKPTRKYVKTIAENVIKNGLPDGTCLNVNIPKAKEEDINGIKVCRQANAYWKEEFEERKDPHNREYYWLTGSFHNLDKGNDTDEFALENKYVSVVPVKFDLTAHELISEIKNWNFDV